MQACYSELVFVGNYFSVQWNYGANSGAMNWKFTIFFSLKMKVWSTNKASTVYLIIYPNVLHYVWITVRGFIEFNFYIFLKTKTSFHHFNKHRPIHCLKWHWFIETESVLENIGTMYVVCGPLCFKKWEDWTS